MLSSWNGAPTITVPSIIGKAQLKVQRGLLYGSTISSVAVRLASLSNIAALQSIFKQFRKMQTGIPDSDRLVILNASAPFAPPGTFIPHIFINCMLNNRQHRNV